MSLVFVLAMLLGAQSSAASISYPFSASTLQTQEVSVAINPANPDTILAATMVGAASPKFTLAWSFDGGDTWQQYEPDGLAYTDADPAVAIRRRDGLWIVLFLARDFGSSIDFAEQGIIWSEDHGQTWEGPLALAPVPVGTIQDKGHLAVDNDPLSPGYGNVYATWLTGRINLHPPPTEPPPNADIETSGATAQDPEITVVRSVYSDLGDGENGIGNWSAPASVADALVPTLTYKWVHTPNVAVGVNGEVYVAFNVFEEESLLVAGVKPDAFGIAVHPGSGDWVNGWQPSQVARPYGGMWKSGAGIPNWGKEVWSYPVLAVDHSSGIRRGTVYLTWISDYGVGDGDIYVVSDLPGVGELPDLGGSALPVGNTNVGSQFIHWAACDPSSGDLVVAYYDRRADPSNTEAEVTVSASSDGGQTWVDRVVSLPGAPMQFSDYSSSNTAFWGHYIGLDVVDGRLVIGWMLLANQTVETLVTTVPTPTAFANRSSDTVFGFAGTPYSSVVFEYSDDGRDDMFLTDAGSDAGIVKGVLNGQAPELPAFENDATNAFPGGTRPTSNRGTAFGDFDGDGDPDLFVASLTSPKIFRNDSGVFTDVTSLVGGSFALGSDYSWCGAWGDFDRDGDLDLYVGRAGGTGDTPSGALQDRLYENQGDGTFVGSAALNSIPHTATTTVAWADVTGDGDLDLFVGSADAGTGSLLLEQQMSLTLTHPTAETVQAFVVASSRLPSSPSSLDEILGATWRDLNNDGALDLLLAGRTTGENGARILWNDGNGSLATTTTLAGGLSSSSAAAVDMNLDGAVDVLVARPAPEVSPSVFRNKKDGTPGAAASFGDLTGVSGLASPGAFRAMQVADIAGPSSSPDGDEDIYLGRPSSSQEFFYQNAPGGVDVTSRRWLKSGLSSGVGNVSNGVGATVHVQAGSLEQTQIVDGGSGVGTQNPSTLVFGLDDTTDDVTVTVDWPDGYTQVETIVNASLDTLHEIVDDHAPGIDASSVGALAVGSPGGSTDWLFSWESDYSSKPSETKVNISGTGGRFCNDDRFENGLVVTASTPGVTIQLEPKPGGGYVHRVIWANQTCGVPCTFSYKVSSGGEWSPTWKSFNTSVCITQ